MRKFTIFTVILTVIIVVVVAELLMKDYLPSLRKGVVEITEMTQLPLPDSLDLSKAIETNVFGAGGLFGETVDPLAVTGDPDAELNEKLDEGDISFEELDLPTDLPVSLPVDVPFGDGNIDSLNSPLPPNDPTSLPKDFEDQYYASYTNNVFLREDQVRSAGFATATVAEEEHNGFLFKSVYIDDLYDVNFHKYSISSGDDSLAKVYVFEAGPLASINDLFEVIKVRSNDGLDTQINETGEYGDRSFYMNDAKRNNVAFLVVRFGSLIYGFSYPKEYHPQIKNLTTLLNLEF